ncbi:MAG: hypothetical protein A2X28_08100 [Elusimicrobia bacterium GWA2_56_46]|nr:MAG: hypothetical protein A2X28_08100 [Elusimicrobia bacterium GWA2_56_46]OGR54283.1 MAG: hypothetical protein A2X39_03610 [Elusimicrobia bacterium GWC2_56_31]HBB66984.1 hypothetical protein [Elusimicrobiota bacterium]HBW22432.1 hypothetical protein [Elusimicrobiota bacterium]
MDEKEKKKESIDEILADLNGLLNKMPDILEGIKLPEIKPADPRSAWKEEPSPASPGSDSAAEPESTPPQSEPPPYSVEPAGLEAAPLLPEIKPVPQEINPERESDLPEAEEIPMAGAAAPEIPEDSPVPPVVEAAPEAGALQDLQKPVVEEKGEVVYDLDSLREEEAAIENAFKPEPEKEEEKKPEPRFEGTRDFGVPDIDTLMKLSKEEILPDGRVEGRGERVEDGGISEPVVSGAVPEEAPEKQEEPFPAIEQAVEPAPEPASESAAEPAPAPEPRLEPEAVVSAPVPENIAIVPAGVGEEGGVMDLKKDDSVNEEKPEPSPEAAENTLSGAENTAGTEPEQSSPREFSLKEKEPDLEEPKLVIEQAGSVFNSDNVTVPGGEDKTVVIPPSAGPEQDRTVIYEAGTDPGAASRGAADLDSLAARPVPEGIPPERVRTVAFLYAAEDAGLCAGALAELDAICLKSPAKPMFIKRAFVQVCEPGNSGNVVMQKVVDSAACGLVCFGDLPQENVFEIENVFTAGGVFFRHLPRESFNHSAALDLVTEFILK